MAEFRFEAEMTPLVERWLLSQQLLVDSEYATPSGICDLVGAELSVEALKNRLRVGQTRAINDARRLALWLAAPDQQTRILATVDELRESLQFRREVDLQREIDWLVREQFLIEPVPGGFQKAYYDWTPLEKRIVAVELKLDRIRDAMRQAVLRSAFADEVYVALPHERAEQLVSPPVLEERPQEHGIGILGVDSDNIRVLIPAQRRQQPLHQILRALCVEHFWHRWVRGLQA